MAFDGKAEAAQFCFDKLKVWNMSWFLGSKLCQCVTFNEVLEFSFTKYWECKVFSTVALCKIPFVCIKDVQTGFIMDNVW